MIFFSFFIKLVHTNTYSHPAHFQYQFGLRKLNSYMSLTKIGPCFRFPVSKIFCESIIFRNLITFIHWERFVFPMIIPHGVPSAGISHVGVPCDMLFLRGLPHSLYCVHKCLSKEESFNATTQILKRKRLSHKKVFKLNDRICRLFALSYE